MLFAEWSSVKMSSLKILICGDVQGNCDLIYTRVNKLLKKGNKFDMLFCVGDFFGDVTSANAWQSYISGSKTAPLPTYILGPNNKEHVNNFKAGSEDGFELCDNITYLGKRGVFTSSSGLRIAYLSGCESPSGSAPAPKHCFTSADTQAIAATLNCSSASYKGVDLLLTSIWPKGVVAYGNAPSSENCKNCGSLLVSELAQSIRPRYHFAALEGVHYERAPYRNHTVLAESARHVTRFIALAATGNTTKQKYLYAFTITPLVHLTSTELNQQPPDATECPYKALKEKDNSAQSGNGGNEQYRWNMNYSENRNSGKKRKSQNDFNRPPRKQSRPQDWSCWFCLGGEKVEKHLVASVGELCYVALAKGGLSWDHVMILPVAHHPSSLELPDDTMAEVRKYKEAIVKAFENDGRTCVVFERCYKTDHMQIQVIPVPNYVASDAVKEAFFKLAESNKDRQGRPNPLELAELPRNTDLKQILSAGCPYFHAELPDGSRLLHKIQRFFPLQFGREALCSESILNMPDRIDWRSCQTSRDHENESAKRFRDFFKKFDFALDEDEDD